MRVVVLSRDLILASRILGEATAGGHDGTLVAEPTELPSASSVDLLFVNWDDRTDAWVASLAEWSASTPPTNTPRLVLYGPHADLQAHAAARAAQLGPMIARSALISRLPDLLKDPPSAR